jgi:hypothetical protein
MDTKYATERVLARVWRGYLMGLTDARWLQDYAAGYMRLAKLLDDEGLTESLKVQIVRLDSIVGTGLESLTGEIDDSAFKIEQICGQLDARIAQEIKAALLPSGPKPPKWRSENIMTAAILYRKQAGLAASPEQARPFLERALELARFASPPTEVHRQTRPASSP